MGSPLLPGWVASGGDPCAEAWQGVQCNGSNIMSIVLNGANLGGQLDDNLGMFASIKAIDLSNNLIGGNIPSNLPVTMQNFFLSANQFSGSIPDSLSSLTLLTDMSLNNNLLSGEIPDAFQSLSGLINLDLSNNNLSGQLPPSMENLSRLTTLRLQVNQLSGTLDVLQDLSLKDLNIENNLFSGPIPEKMLNIPSFRKDGNPFNSTIAPLPAPTSPLAPSHSPPRSETPTSDQTPGKHANGPSASEGSNSREKKNFLTTKRVVWISVAGVLFFIILALGVPFFMPKCSRVREEAGIIFKRHQVGAYGGNREKLGEDGPVPTTTSQTEKGPKEAVTRPVGGNQTERGRMGAIAKLQNEKERNVERTATTPKRFDHEIDMSRFDMTWMETPPLPPPPPPPPPPPLSEKVIVKPIVPDEVTTARPSAKTPKPSTFAKSFTIAALQQYTNSFSQENLIGGGMLGSVYRAELPDGKLLAVKKLDKRVASQQKDDEFIELIENIDRIQHVNIVRLMGYCAEHGQKLLIYEYCGNGSLQDVLHADDEFQKKFAWNARIRMALAAARALEYLHGACQPPVVHRNFKSANVLLDDDLDVRVADCGLASLIASGSVSQLSGQLQSIYGYGAPEFETGIYTSQSDVYSFGVFMLELLTARKSYDRTRSRGEQFLVRWAIPQLHDIEALSRMVDPSLNGEYPAKSLSRFVDIISRCLQSEPEFRPPMSEVVQDLLDIVRRERPSNESNGD
ncbi:protein STRUBBELIG-RECEPTOR FAMILY 3-like isoform X2 [Durio zibethinus]|nr:protein STRUBBELIG-RECEPTOR FAMILY 3-like isoform X2 [Durio zibethinus]XP_022764034.1 protein STRUBBELIG-RECEPTOR FAMILY 3-like isoform X2 [Durio zibethinus]